MHQVLMVAYHFPPAGGGGVQRTAKFSKYLPEFGWQPVVLTVRADAYDLKDESLLADISDTFPIVRTPIARPWLINDIGIRWLPYLLKSASQIFFHENNIKVVYLTGNPFFPFLVGFYISKRFQVPYVLDFRDAWTLGPYLKPVTSKGRIARRLAILIEKQVIRQASKVVCVCEPMREDFVRSYPHEPAAKFAVIPNGFDPVDLLEKGVEPEAFHSLKHLVKITYVGKFTPYRTPVQFLRAVKLLLGSHPDLAQEIKIVFVGHSGEETQQLIRALGLEDIVIVIGWVPHQQSIQFLHYSDILLLITGGHRSEQTGKVFEYIATGKPVVALAPLDGAVAEVLRQANTGLIVPHDEVKQIAAGLKEAIEQIQNGRQPVPDWQAIARYERRNLTGQLAEILDRVSRGDG